MFCPSMVICPSNFVPGIRSFMRLKSLRKVDLPQPEGPMNATTSFSSMLMLMPFNAWKLP